MSIWVQLAKGESHLSNNREKWVSLFTFCRWELKLSSLTHGVKVAHVAASWNRCLSSLLSSIIEGPCFILPLELNKKEMSDFVIDNTSFCLVCHRSSDHCLTAEDASLLGSWSVTTEVLCFRLNWQQVAYALSLCTGTLQTEGREERGFRLPELREHLAELASCKLRDTGLCCFRSSSAEGVTPELTMRFCDGGGRWCL